MFNKVIVANRGAVAARIIRGLHALGVRSVAVYSEADADLPYLEQADEAFPIGAAEPRASYLNQERILEVAMTTGADGLHPGYGFLSENAEFARRVEALGVGFIGPSPHWIEALGHKVRARELMARHGVPMGLASDLLTGDMAEAMAAAAELGYPVLVKPVAGGGGIGMLPAKNPQELQRALEQARTMAQRSFGNADLYLERLLTSPRHIEFQLLADRHGSVRHLFERECSVQRRHQKILEESPAPRLPREWVARYGIEISDAMDRLRYDVIGTVETLNDGSDQFSFLEMNTRLQVEHAVTEEITGIDLVVAQVRLAAGRRLSDVLPQEIAVRGHAIEVRIYAEDSVRFYPSPGLLKVLAFPAMQGIRVETGYAQGNRVTPYYDPLIAKLIAHAPSRDEALYLLEEALERTVIEGVRTNIDFLKRVLADENFKAGFVDTGIVARILAQPAA